MDGRIETERLVVCLAPGHTTCVHMYCNLNVTLNNGPINLGNLVPILGLGTLGLSL